MTNKLNSDICMLYDALSEKCGFTKTSCVYQGKNKDCPLLAQYKMVIEGLSNGRLHINGSKTIEVKVDTRI